MLKILEERISQARNYLVEKEKERVRKMYSGEDLTPKKKEIIELRAQIAILENSETLDILAYNSVASNVVFNNLSETYEISRDPWTAVLSPLDFTMHHYGWTDDNPACAIDGMYDSKGLLTLRFGHLDFNKREPYFKANDEAVIRYNLNTGMLTIKQRPKTIKPEDFDRFIGHI